MKLKVLALDYDGTIAENGVLEQDVRAAIAEAREQGLYVILVTGRILADLERVAGDLQLFDGVVAENGAVVYFPESERSLLLSAAPSALFLKELSRRNLPYLIGESVVELDASHAADVLEVIQETQLPLVLLFNRGRMMVLPQAVSKATGLREILRALRLSTHNAIGIGDAENDHQLLSCCEVGLAVEWGSPALKATADEVLHGEGPRAVARYIERLTAEPRIPPDRLARRKTHLGVRKGGEPFELALRGRNVLIGGDTLSGKSWLTGVLCEQLALEHYCVCIIDPEGEYATLESLPSVVVFDAAPHPPGLDDVERTLRYPDVSVVVDLSSMERDAKCRYVYQLLERLRDLRRRTGLPHRIVVDEAHYFLNDRDTTGLLDFELGGYTLVTWHVSKLEPAALSASETIIVTRISDPEEAKALHALRGREYDLEQWSEELRSLEHECAALLPGTEYPASGLVRFRVSARLTEHVRHLRKYLGQRAPTGRAFVFDCPGPLDGVEAHSLEELLAALSTGPDLSLHLRGQDLSRWIGAVLGDELLARSVREIERRWASEPLEHPHLELISAIRTRYSADCSTRALHDESRRESSSPATV